MKLKSLNEFLSDKLFEDSFADWANVNKNFQQIIDENWKLKEPVNYLIRNHGKYIIGWYDNENHSIIKRIGRTLIDSQDDFNDQIIKLVEYIDSCSYVFIKETKYDFHIKSKNCHFLFTYNPATLEIYIITIIPQQAVDCSFLFEIE